MTTSDDYVRHLGRRIHPTSTQRTHLLLINAYQPFKT